MKTLIALLLMGIAQADPAVALWPKQPFKHVVGYCYVPSQDLRGSAITFDDGTLHQGVIRATTVRLNETQIEKLRKILNTDSAHKSSGGLCYEPHHAFVFYDTDWKIAASIDICFLCEGHVSRPEKASDKIDLPTLKVFCQELGLPILKSSAEYAKLFQQEQPPKPAAPKQKPAF